MTIKEMLYSERGSGAFGIPVNFLHKQSSAEANIIWYFPFEISFKQSSLLGFVWTSVIPRPFISFVCSSTMSLRLSGEIMRMLTFANVFAMCWTLDKLNFSQIWLEVSQVHLSLPTGLHRLSLFLFQGCYDMNFFQTYLKFVRHWQKLWFCWVLIVASAFLTDVDRLAWKS